MAHLVQRILVLFLALLLVPMLAPTGSAQESPLYLQMELIPERTAFVIEPNGLVEIEILIRDRSFNGFGALVPEGSAAAFPNQVSFALEADPEPGWQVTAPGVRQTRAGEEATTTLVVSLGAAVQSPFYDFIINGTITGAGGAEPYSVAIRFQAYSPGIAGFFALTESGFQQAGPNTVLDYNIGITNQALLARSFDLEVTSNPCDLAVGTESGVTVNAKDQTFTTVNLRSPDQKLLYLSELCQVTIVISPQDNPDAQQTVILSVQTDGFYVAPEWVFTVIFLLLALLLLLLVLKRRKERIEEELLGKPQKPWLIPAEKLYLEELKEQDPKAWYLVRKFLMVEEYRSSMAWFKAYKQATKGNRKKERLILVQERKLRRIENQTARNVAGLERSAERFEARMLRKGGRKSKKAHKKDLKKWTNEVAKLDAKANKDLEKRTKAWEKECAKLKKRGQPLPPRPLLIEPEKPDRPEFVPPTFADLPKLDAKAQKRYQKAEKQIAKVEAKGEKGYQKMLKKVRKKVRKLARKLDDPEFEKRHQELFA